MTTAPAPGLVQRARTLLRPPPTSVELWQLPRLTGRVVEVSEAGAFGALSVVAGLLCQAQSAGEALAWVAAGSTVFFPPDLAYRGVDLQALTLIRIPGPPALAAADLLTRSGAFGLVVVDGLGPTVEEGALGRLAKVAEDRQTAVLFLTRKGAGDSSLGTQVSLRVVVTLTGEGETRWQVVKDKRVGPASAGGVRFDGPSGLY